MLENIFGWQFPVHIITEFDFIEQLGAFLAGAILAETNFRTQIEADIRPFRGLLLGLFFVTTGSSIDIEVLENYVKLCFLGSIFQWSIWLCFFNLIRINTSEIAYSLIILVCISSIILLFLCSFFSESGQMYLRSWQV